MTFEYTDATGERVYFRPAVVNAHQPTQAVAMETETGRPVYFAVDQLEDVIAGMRDVRRQAAGQPAAAAPLAPCETTRHCATHGFCHRCAPESSKAAQYLVKAISAAEVDDARAGAVYARLAAELFAPECPQCDDTGACNGGPCAHPAAGQPDTQQQAEPAPVVAYRDPRNPRVLLCRDHGRKWHGVVPLTADDLPDGGICVFGRLSSFECGRDVLADEAAR